MHDFMDLLRNKLLIGSGAIATCLRKTHGGLDPVELLNVTQPELVTALHKQYKKAGSNILITNTFAANYLALDDAGIADQCENINRQGVEHAREAAEKDCAVWASIGPLSLGLRHDDFSQSQLVDIYSQQCDALCEADALVLETFTDVREARAAVAAASQSELPFILQIGNLGYKDEQWDRIEQFIELGESSGAIAIGTNCGHPTEIITVAEYLASRTHLPITASPNAGQPVIKRGAIIYDLSPADYLNIAKRLASVGVSVIGGCCGTTPEHIAKIADLANKPVVHREHIESKLRTHTVKHSDNQTGINMIRDLISSDKFIISVEIRPERKQTMDQILAGASIIAEAGADMFDVPDNPGATIGRDAVIVASALQRTLHIPSISHMTVTQSNLLQIHSRLIGCWDMGLQGILAVTGDSPSIGELAHSANRVKDLRSSVELLRLIKMMKDGNTINGQPIANSPNLCAGASTGIPNTAQLAWLKKKIEAGAEYVFSQPVFSYEDFEEMHEAIMHLNIRLFPGIMPLSSAKNADYLSSGKIPGIKVPKALAEEFARYPDKKDQKRLGIDKALELAHKIAAQAQGLYLIMPFGRSCYEDAAEIVTSLKQSQQISGQCN